LPLPSFQERIVGKQIYVLANLSVETAPIIVITQTAVTMSTVGHSATCVIA